MNIPKCHIEYRSIKEGRRLLIFINCSYCKKEYTIRIGHFKTIIARGNKNYCSKSCASSDKVGENSRSWKGGKKEYKCDYCGKLFFRNKCHQDRTNKNACSVECRHKLHKGFNSPKKHRIKVNCLQCGIEFELIPCRIHEKNFCNQKCFGEYHRGKNSSLWVNGNTEYEYPRIFSNKLKDTVRERDEKKCVLCGLDELKNERKLSVHHIDYDRENCSMNNLVSLCDVCHGKTHGNRNYWIEYFKNKNYN